MARRLTLDAFEAGLRAVDPYSCVRSTVKITGTRFSAGPISLKLSTFRNILLLAVGKASGRMTTAALDIMEDLPVSGVLIAPKSQKLPTIDSRIEVHHTGHPIPDEDGTRTSERVIELVKKAQGDDLLLCLISGGASALLPSPSEGILLEDKIDITKQLLRSGASIHEINTVRRHLSKLKGGRLIELCPISTVLSLIISDVPGNQLHDIGSGLTTEDPTTFSDAIQVLQRNHVWRKAPSRIRALMLKGLHRRIPETPKSGDFQGKVIHNILIADNRKACDASYRKLMTAGVDTTVMTSSAEMRARDMGSRLAAMAQDMAHRENARRLRPRAVIIGGETTVQVTGLGKGGRNQEAVLSAAIGIAGLKGTAAAAIGTDGIDGNSDAAGAIADGNTLSRSARKKLNLRDFQERNDSNRFFRRMGDTLVTGATGTNVGDLYLAISIE